MPEWLSDIQTMDIFGVISKWQFLMAIKGLNLGSNPSKYDSLVKRFNRLTEDCSKTTAIGVLEFIFRKSSDVGPLVFDVRLIFLYWCLLFFKGKWVITRIPCDLQKQLTVCVDPCREHWPLQNTICKGCATALGYIVQCIQFEPSWGACKLTCKIFVNFL